MFTFSYIFVLGIVLDILLLLSFLLVIVIQSIFLFWDAKEISWNVHWFALLLMQ